MTTILNDSCNYLYRFVVARNQDDRATVLSCRPRGNFEMTTHYVSIARDQHTIYGMLQFWDIEALPKFVMQVTPNQKSRHVLISFFAMPNLIGEVDCVCPGEDKDADDYKGHRPPVNALTVHKGKK